MAKIKERHHRAPFEKQIERGEYTITLYNIKYPEKYEEKLEFYRDFDILMKKLLVYESTINILYPERLKADILELEDNLLLPEEDFFAKSSSELSQVGRDAIDKKIDININKDLGRTQYYLNKQVYFWQVVLNKETNIQKNYSELDKERLILEVESVRKKMFEISNQVDLTAILRVEEPYSVDTDHYWQEKDVYINRKSELAPEIFKSTNYLFIDHVKNTDVEKIISEQLKFDSKIIIVQNNLYDGYTVVNGKYIFFTGGKYKTNYYEGYEIKFKIKDVTLEDLLAIDDNLLISDFLNPNLYEERQGK
jgi:hypothetical protein